MTLSRFSDTTTESGSNSSERPSLAPSASSGSIRRRSVLSNAESGNLRRPHSSLASLLSPQHSRRSTTDFSHINYDERVGHSFSSHGSFVIPVIASCPLPLETGHKSSSDSTVPIPIYSGGNDVGVQTELPRMTSISTQTSLKLTRVFGEECSRPGPSSRASNP